MLFAELETSTLVAVATFISIVSGALGAVLMKVLPVWQANRSRQEEDRRLTEAQSASLKREALDQVAEEYQGMLQRAAEDARKRDEVISRQDRRLEELFSEVRALTAGHADCLVKNERMAARVEILEARLAHFRVSEEIADIPTRSEAILVADEQGVIREWNQAATVLLHWGVEEAVGRSIDLIVPPRWLAAHRAGWQRIVNDGHMPRRGPFFVTALTREHEEVPVELILSGWEIGGRRYFSASLRQRVELPSAPGPGRDIEEDVPIGEMLADPDPVGSSVHKKDQKDKELQKCLETARQDGINEEKVRRQEEEIRASE